MRTNPRQLYSLLPEYYRQRDVELGGPLKDLLDVIEEELNVIEGDLDQLYDDWFIETCQERMVPLIGYLVGVSDGPLGRPPSRAQVAGAIASRRRKGTPGALAFALRAATGWGVHVVEHPPRRVLEVTEDIDIVEIGDETLIEARETIRAPVQAPFGARVEGERHEPGLGEKGGVSIFLWPRRCTPRDATVAKHLGAGRFTFEPSGRDSALYNIPQRLNHRFDRSAARTLPLRLSRKMLRAELKAIRESGSGPRGFFVNPPAFRIWVQPHGGAGYDAVPLQGLAIADLADWRAPSEDRQWDVAVDPELGRILFRQDPGRVMATWCTVSPDILDAASATPDPEDAKVYLVAGGPIETAPGETACTSVAEALQACAGSESNVLIRILDSGTYAPPHEAFHLPAGVTVQITAAPYQEPTLEGRWRFHARPNSGPIRFQGLRFAGPIETHGPALLFANRCILNPPSAGQAAREESAPHAALRAGGSDAPVEFHLTNCVCGPIEMPADMGIFFADGSILDAAFADALHSGSVRIRRCTILGDVEVDRLEEANEVIFAGHVHATSPRGQVSFCALPRGSRTPGALHCYYTGRDEASVAEWFESTRFGDAGYAHLSSRAPLAVEAGAEDGSEIGAYHDLGERAQWALIESVLREFLPYGLPADVFIVT